MMLMFNEIALRAVLGITHDGPIGPTLEALWAEIKDPGDEDLHWTTVEVKDVDGQFGGVRNEELVMIDEVEFKRMLPPVEKTLPQAGVAVTWALSPTNAVFISMIDDHREMTNIETHEPNEWENSSRMVYDWMLDRVRAWMDDRQIEDGTFVVWDDAEGCWETEFHAPPPSQDPAKAARVLYDHALDAVLSVSLDRELNAPEGGTMVESVSIVHRGIDEAHDPPRSYHGVYEVKFELVTGGSVKATVARNEIEYDDLPSGS